VYEALYMNRVSLEGSVLKPSMVISGKKCSRQAGVDEVAERTVRILKRTVPAAVAGIAFLSGGQSDEVATAHLNAMNQLGNLPWPVSFSYGRALQQPSLKAWLGQAANVAAAQAALAHRARMNGLATQGKYSAALEKQAA
jgi:fructose-bisphosphate aldolase class I